MVIWFLGWRIVRWAPKSCDGKKMANFFLQNFPRRGISKFIFPLNFFPRRTSLVCKGAYHHTSWLYRGTRWELYSFLHWVLMIYSDTLGYIKIDYGAPLVLVITFWSPILQLSYVILFILPFLYFFIFFYSISIYFKSDDQF